EEPKRWRWRSSASQRAFRPRRLTYSQQASYCSGRYVYFAEVGSSSSYVPCRYASNQALERSALAVRATFVLGLYCSPRRSLPVPSWGTSCSGLPLEGSSRMRARESVFTMPNLPGSSSLGRRRVYAWPQEQYVWQ